MKKTRIFYPVLWACFISGVMIGTIGANIVSKEMIQSLGIYQMYTNMPWDTFFVLEKDWIMYILINRMKFWILYVLLAFTAVRQVITFTSSVIFGCIGAILLVAMTRLWGSISILLFCITWIPHYILYIIAFLCISEAVRIMMITPKTVVIEKVVVGSVYWCLGIIGEIFVNPTIVYWVMRVVRF